MCSLSSCHERPGFLQQPRYIPRSTPASSKAIHLYTTYESQSFGATSVDNGCLRLENWFHRRSSSKKMYQICSVQRMWLADNHSPLSLNGAGLRWVNPLCREPKWRIHSLEGGRAIRTVDRSRYLSVSEAVSTNLFAKFLSVLADRYELMHKYRSTQLQLVRRKEMAYRLSCK